MVAPTTSASFHAELARRERFESREMRFLTVLDEDRVTAAQVSLREMLGSDHLAQADHSLDMDGALGCSHSSQHGSVPNACIPLTTTTAAWLVRSTEEQVRALRGRLDGRAGGRSTPATTTARGL